MTKDSSSSGRDMDKEKKKEQQSVTYHFFTLPNGAKKFMKEYRTPLASAAASSIATGILVSAQFLAQCRSRSLTMTYSFHLTL